jgi:hypothetical protein
MPPYLLLSALIGAIYGTLFYLWQGKIWRDLPIYLVAGVAGFGLGQALGAVIGFNLVLIGPIHFVEATIICWVSLFLARWLKI